ncbi:MAG: SDR family NAD(P)-dependent oxidoreductase [Candidatus Palauibacterales bacterium]|nr:SDR family NAD(P)-dependent oxidoreductase [Candidatus Palauibacterales bacterium]MDP2528847.1 SDR family NAD(P)-dependent oxidoreductase [Candidatus Palauibacterales bacterium]
MSLEGRTAVVTGGGRGIGAAAARALAGAGAAVAVSARTAREIEAVADGIRSGGGRAVAVPCDVTDPEAVEALAGAAAAELGRVDVLVHAAGIASSAPIRHLELEEWRRVLEVNATGAFLCTRAFLPGMAERGWGRIVYVASVAGLAGARYIAAYAASKHAVVGLARCAAAEVAGRGVTVNALCPGYVDTAMTRDAVADIAATTDRTPEEALGFLLSQNPQGRLIEPGEVADAAVWLCGEGARGVNGQAVVIDGGELLA